MTTKLKNIASLAFALLLIAVTFFFALAAPGETVRVSVSSEGTEADSYSLFGAITPNGRYVIFHSYATNLVVGDTNGDLDIFRRDLQTNTTERVSLTHNGLEANSASMKPNITPDGRYVVFESSATNLVANDTNSANDIFLRDIQSGTTERVSVATGGAQVNDNSFVASVSEDGRYIAFHSWATNLVTGDTNFATDVFVHDRQSSTTSRVSVHSNGTQGNGISSDAMISGNGRYVVFRSSATNLAAGDSDSTFDIYVHDRQTNTTELVSVNSDGVKGNDASEEAFISTDGRFVVFTSYASNLVAGDTNGERDVFVRDRLNGTTERVSVATGGAQANDTSIKGIITPDGRYVAFLSFSTNLTSVPLTGNAWRVYVRDQQEDKTWIVSLRSDGTSPSGYTEQRPSISVDGRFVIFDSTAWDLVSNDTNSFSDIFLHENNLPPTDILLSSNSVLENQPANTVVGQFSTSDGNNPGDTFTYALVSGSGSADNASFSIDGNTLKTGHPFNYLGKTSYNIRVQTTDSRGLTYQKAFTISVTDAAPIFSDVADTFWAASFIERLYNNGITSGFPDGTYRPENNVTRAEIAVFLLKSMNGSTYSASPASPTFSDTSGHWAQNWIEALKTAGITGGYPDGTYKPDNTVTRAEMAVFLLKAKHGSAYTPTPASPTFSDTSGHWAQNWIEALKAEGITGGYPDGTYRPDNTVSRAEMAVFVISTFGLP
jgi:hypothetical protein